MLTVLVTGIDSKKLGYRKIYKTKHISVVLLVTKGEKQKISTIEHNVEFSVFFEKTIIFRLTNFYHPV